jgi:hypothetical protein
MTNKKLVVITGLIIFIIIVAASIRVFTDDNTEPTSINEESQYLVLGESRPIFTPTPFFTSTPSPSPVPTNTPTPTPTSTPTPTNTPTPLPTNTPPPTPIPEAYEAPVETIYTPQEGCLTASGGVFNGPSGRETWYNLPMDGVISIMRNAGFSEEEYPYWVREDGCRMLGDYIMVAANFDIRPRGSTLATSLGTGLVCDTGTFIYTYPYGVDIAVDW